MNETDVPSKGFPAKALVSLIIVIALILMSVKYAGYPDEEELEPIFNANTPEWKEGDLWTFEYHIGFATRNASFLVTDPEFDLTPTIKAYHLESNFEGLPEYWNSNDFTELDAHGRSQRHILNFPLVDGKNWTSTTQEGVSYRYEVSELHDITLPLIEGKAYRAFEIRESIVSNGEITLAWKYQYAPEFRFFVRIESHSQLGLVSWMQLSSMENVQTRYQTSHASIPSIKYSPDIQMWDVLKLPPLTGGELRWIQHSWANYTFEGARLNDQYLGVVNDARWHAYQWLGNNTPEDAGYANWWPNGPGIRVVGLRPSVLGRPSLSILDRLERPWEVSSFAPNETTATVARMLLGSVEEAQIWMEQSGNRFILLDSDMMPYLESNTGEFSAMVRAADLETSDFLGVTDSGSIAYHEDFRSSMLFRSYIGFTLAEIGIDSARDMPGINTFAKYPKPGWMLEHFRLVYRTYYWNPAEGSNQRFPMSYLEGVELQAKEGGTLTTGIRDGVVILQYYQGTILNGTITNQFGDPMPGIRVTAQDGYAIPHSTKVTGPNGQYSLRVPTGSNSTLIFSTGGFNGSADNMLEQVETEELDRVWVNAGESSGLLMPGLSDVFWTPSNGIQLDRIL